jgi:hypothetical protein
VLSDQSRQNLANLFERAAHATLLRSPEHSWEITRESGNATGALAAGEPLLVITTSSFRFRLLTLFHVADNQANRDYFAPGATGGTVQDGFAEVANLCCGALNREISAIYSHLAMSVPSRLSGACLEYLVQLEPEYTSRFTITINGTARVGVTLCMCCTAPVDIPVTLATAEQSSGELELF